MGKLYSRVFRTMVLWAILLVAMGIMAGTSAAVLAANRARPLSGCGGACADDSNCSGQDPLCVCQIDNCRYILLRPSAKQ